MTGKKHSGAYGRAIGAENRDEIKGAMAKYLGITNREMSKLLGISVDTIGRHVRAIRKDWKE